MSDHELHAAVLELHGELAMRDCASTAIIKAMAGMSKDMPESIAAGLLSLGGHHAPIDQAMQVWKFGGMPEYFDQWETIPGFGSSWYRGEPDPAFNGLRELLPDRTLHDLDCLTEAVQAHYGKMIFPNAAMYTAVTADVMGKDSKFATSLLVRGRIDSWCLIWVQHYRELT